MKKSTVFVLVFMMFCAVVSAGGSADSVPDVMQTTEEIIEHEKSTLETIEEVEKTSLSEAVESGDYQVARMLISEGENVNVFTSEGEPIIFPIIESSQYYIAELIIDAGVDINLIDENGKTALFVMTELTSSPLYGNSTYLELFDKMIEEGANIHHVDNKGNTPLLSAARLDKTDLVRKLVNAGADVNYNDKQGNSSLYYSTINGNKSLVSLFVNSGSTVDFSKPSEKSIIDTIMKTNNIDIAEVIAPVTKNMNTPNSEGQTLLDFVLSKNNILMAEIFIASGATDFDESKLAIDDTNVNDYFEFALKNDNTALIEMVVGKGIDVESIFENNKTPLILACETGSLEVVTVLFEKGADIEALDVKGNTALMHASKNGYDDIVQFLITNDAYLNAENNERNTGLKMALSNDHFDVFNSLLKAGADIGTAWSTGCKIGKTEFVLAMLEHGADIDQTVTQIVRTNNYGGGYIFEKYTGLMLASYEGHLDVVKVLVQAGANIHSLYDYPNRALYVDVIKPSGNALSEAYRGGNMDVFKYLLENGADPNVIIRKPLGGGIDESLTFLFTVVENNDASSVKLLLDHGADADKGEVLQDNSKEDSGWGVTPLMNAAYLGYTDVTKELIDGGADVNLKIGSSSAIDFARDKGYTQIVNLLKRAGAEE